MVKISSNLKSLITSSSLEATLLLKIMTTQSTTKIMTTQLTTKRQGWPPNNAPPPCWGPPPIIATFLLTPTSPPNTHDTRHNATCIWRCSKRKLFAPSRN